MRMKRMDNGIQLPVGTANTIGEERRFGELLAARRTEVLTIVLASHASQSPQRLAYSLHFRLKMTVITLT